MARHGVADRDWASIEPAAAALLGQYLAAIAARLPGPRRARTAAITELHDGLCDDYEYHRGHGLGSVKAANEVITDSGPVHVVATAYAGVLADLQARRTGQAFLFTGPVIGLLWLFALTPGERPDTLLLTIPPLGFLVVAAALAGVLTLAATGTHARRLRQIPHLPQLGAVSACVAAAAGDVAVLTAGAGPVLGDLSTTWAVFAFAVAASLLRLAYSQHAARLHLRATASGR